MLRWLGKEPFINPRIENSPLENITLFPQGNDDTTRLEPLIPKGVE